MSNPRRGSMAVSAVAAGLIAGPVSAELSPQDVLDSFVETYAALGMRYVGTLTEADGTLTKEAGHLHLALPMALGDVVISHPDLTLRPLPDGAVEVTMQNMHDGGLTISLLDPFLAIEDAQVELALDMTVVTEDYAMIVTGTTDEMVFRTTAAMMDLTFANLRGAGMPEFDDVDIFVGLRATGTETVTIMTAHEDRMELAFGSISGETIVEVTVEELFDDWWRPEPVAQLSRSVSVIDRGESTGRIVLPRAPLDWLNLAAALRGGLALEMTTLSEGQITQSVAYEDDMLISEQDQRSGRVEQQLALNAEALSVSGIARDVTLSFTDAFLSTDRLEIALVQGAGELTIPVSQGPDLQDLMLTFTLDGLTLSDATWGLFDDRGALGRDAMSLEMRLALGVQLDADLLDFGALGELDQSTDLPFALTRIALDPFRFDGLGLDVLVSGAFDIPPGAFDIFSDASLPVGNGRMELSGFDDLLDTLVANGVLPRAEASGLRIGLAAISRADGPDRVVSDLEITDEGHVIVNGQRMK